MWNISVEVYVRTNNLNSKIFLKKTRVLNMTTQAAQVVGWALGQSVMPSTWQVGGNVTLVIGVPMT